MPVNTDISSKLWVRYAFARDNGHTQFVDKANKCERFFAGDQWEPADKARLQLARRPALTINKIISTIGNVMGEQIFNRNETTFRPRTKANEATAEVLAKVFKQISDNNQLDWKRSDMFADGVITGRGFLDIRIGYNDSMQGEVVIDNLNPKNVIVDPDADSYDPDTWSEVFVTKWLTADDIAVLYSPTDAEILRYRENSYFPYGYDSISANRDRFGNRQHPQYAGPDFDATSVMRNVRVIERQHRMLDRQKHFVSAEGDTRQIPDDFDRNKIAWFVEKYGFQVITKLVRRIRWTVIADNVVLHDEWSPYKHFTVVPFFPYFRRGTTIGLVENLIGSQELLNKVSSQELHVVNTTANSGYKVRSGSLTNMTPQELEQRGAETGIVIETSGDPDKDIVKIQPNAVPQGLDRISYKAEEHIKTISGVNDGMTGFVREDVAAKAIEKNKQSGATGLAKPMDSLSRTDHMIGTRVLALVQEFYTEERVLTITKDRITGETEEFVINQVNAAGEVINDLTLGEYGVVTTSVPQRDTAEDSQFEQAISMREMGIAIPDDVIVDASRLQNKSELVKRMRGDKDSPEAQAQAELQMRGQAAEVAKLEGEAQQKAADAGLKQAKATETIVKARVLANTPIEDPNAGQGGEDPALAEAKAVHEADLEERKFEHTRQLDFMKLGMEREKQTNDLRLKAFDMAAKRAEQRAAAQQQAAAQAQRPTSTPTK